MPKSFDKIHHSRIFVLKTYRFLDELLGYHSTIYLSDFIYPLYIRPSVTLIFLATNVSGYMYIQIRVNKISHNFITCIHSTGYEPCKGSNKSFHRNRKDPFVDPSTFPLLCNRLCRFAPLLSLIVVGSIALSLSAPPLSFCCSLSLLLFLLSRRSQLPTQIHFT